VRRSLEEHDQLISIQQDLETAREIQQAILPKIFPPFPERSDFDIYAAMIAAKEVGGDFYDFFLIDEDRIGFVIGDVSGKGIPAAIFMAVSRTLIRATGLKGIPTDECMHYVNNLLCNESVSSMFVTVFYGILNTRTGEIDYVNGGHNPPYHMTATGIAPVPMTGGIILGCMEEFQFRSGRITLGKGDSIFLYTDGVTEAFNKEDVAYGDERLETFLKAHLAHPVNETVKHLFEEVNQFSLGIPQSDDITMMIIRYNGK
jgi:sigma-B regulation protein RsbU (phosphoserine phosphatase)